MIVTIQTEQVLSLEASPLLMKLHVGELAKSRAARPPTSGCEGLDHVTLALQNGHAPGQSRLLQIVVNVEGG